MRSSRYSPDELTRAARQGFAARFLRQVDPDGTLPEAERERRAEAARRAWMLALAAKSAEARRRRTVSTEAGHAGPLESPA